jgi:Zn-dependent protease
VIYLSDFGFGISDFQEDIREWPFLAKVIPVFFEPSNTSYDLRFRLFGIPVRIHPMFWLLCLILGSSIVDMPDKQDPTMRRFAVPLLLIWIGCVLVSILIHEMGHVLMGRLFGAQGHIVLYGFGGLAIGSNHLNRRWQRILVSLAGPLSQLLIFALVMLGCYSLVIPGTPGTLEGLLFRPRALGEVLTGNTLLFLLEINLFWPLLNLLPIWPLDGGQVMREIMEGLLPRRGAQLALGLSGLLAGLLAANALANYFDKSFLPLGPVLAALVDFPVIFLILELTILPLLSGRLFSALLFGYLAMGSWQALQALEEEKRWLDDRWEV